MERLRKWANGNADACRRRQGVVTVRIRVRGLGEDPWSIMSILPSAIESAESQLFLSGLPKVGWPKC